MSGEGLVYNYSTLLYSKKLYYGSPHSGSRVTERDSSFELTK